ncbi:hypothetical protein L226DRAFT_530548 [Lentinus tigrinus ALCF2SS1-7]|uniref:Nudix hydrolase domain-containing protein n=1 Tax=Lentinus tigrinus ALCF2SS1-6 TaxID=1328759 RepID=A0A5C2ST34_9APHY|nr:hypothetical protein L227DRAFT_570331 [Lentinus tigrinus ALCF2SS1-6]RPD80383.1 hypothetical protein L226DRAFT_530548 [Lentinus tigrinus ALCF2SS1-7]
MSSTAGTARDKPTPAVPRPSATVIVVNSRNEILLVHRNPKSKSFANAHVFPGGNYDKKQDEGHGLPFTAIRELFEESGLLLVHPSSSGIPSNAELDAAREAIHAQQRLFRDFLSEHNLKPNIEGLMPFTRWITPPNIPRRFDARFYVTFLDDARSAGFSSGDKQERLPTPDGGQEVIEARFVHPAKALEEFHAQRISLFPPQFYLLKTLADILHGAQNTAAQRDTVRTLSQGAFGRMVINPRPVRDPEAQAEGFSVLTYEGDEARGGSPGRRHRSRLKFGQGGAANQILLERNFDIFTEIEEHAFSQSAKL